MPTMTFKKRIYNWDELTRAEAVKELSACYANVAECEATWERVNASQHGYIGRSTALDDCMSDYGAYSDCIAELEAFLSSDTVRLVEPS